MILVCISVGISLVGSFYNATLRLKLSYVLWLISNVCLCAHNFAIGEYAQAFMFGALLIMTFIGLRSTIRDKYWFRPNK
ncbi:MAG: hypothetical protein LBI61_04310 [Puniceicoccales bacterium]|jgi:hypothetical protein|nr:hypothetical protein [Puniceicoccales bacterium]